MSHVSKESGIEGAFFFAYCGEVIGEDPVQFLKSGWIRPEDIGKYSEITDYFKIVGRAMPRSKVIRCIKAYLKQSWDGNVLDLLCASLNTYNLTHYDYLDNKGLDEYNFFEKISTCDRNCRQCGYCDELAKKLIVFGECTQENLEGTQPEYYCSNT
jgi:collagenase-like PrtC family protease